MMRMNEKLRKAIHNYWNNRWGNVIIPSRSKIKFGFFGEFGYGLISWLPYLKFLSENGVAIHGLGLKGTDCFWNFAASFTTVDIPSGDRWGSRKELKNAKKSFSGSKIIAPVNRWTTGLSVNGLAWENPELHRMLKTNCYSRLKPEALDPDIGSPYVVINFKNYFNWGNPDIRNFYSLAELVSLVKLIKDAGLVPVLNRFPAPIETDSLYFSDSENGVKELIDAGAVDMAAKYQQYSTLAERNKLQVGLLKESIHIFATQGGNAALALITGASVSVLMRGGMDYPDYCSLAKIYGSKIEIAYEIRQFNCLGDIVL